MTSRKKGTYFPSHLHIFREKAISWASGFDHVHLFNSNGYRHYPFGGFADFLIAGCAGICPIIPYQTFASLQQYYDAQRDWLIGYFSYDIKNEIEALHSKNKDTLQFPAAYFYIPRHIIHFTDNQIIIETLEDPHEVYSQICLQTLRSEKINFNPIVIQQRTPAAVYMTHVEQIKKHILEGDVYELNYCMEFYAEQVQIEPLAVYKALNKKSPMPFSVYGRINDYYVMCASPERFLKKTGTKLISQPIKGTAPRGNTPQEDEHLKQLLRTNEKELAENMMIVDLVRNDLARSARTGSIRVEEMFGIYTFPQVHQMISTVSAQMRSDLPFTQAIQHAFPMGSMTGAPKIKAMQLIDEYELAYRGVYSGAVGYITPEADFDFNVVIRSILYNAQTGYLSFQAGSAITYDASTGQEYAECLLKAKAMQSIFKLS